MTKHPVAAVDEIAEGACKLVRLEGMDIGVLRIAGEHRAYRNLCPHAGAPLFAARPDGVEFERGTEQDSVRCPWHGWEFDLRTGAFLRNPRCLLDSYRVEVVDGAVCVWV